MPLGVPKSGMSRLCNSWADSGSISWWEESAVNSPVLPAQCPAASLATWLATGGREPPCSHSAAAQWQMGCPVLARQLCPTAGPSTSHGASGGVCRELSSCAVCSICFASVNLLPRSTPLSPYPLMSPCELLTEFSQHPCVSKQRLSHQSPPEPPGGHWVQPGTFCWAAPD